MCVCVVTTSIFFKYLILQYGVSNMRTAIFDYLRKVLGGPPGHAI